MHKINLEIKNNFLKSKNSIWIKVLKWFSIMAYNIKWMAQNQ